MKNQEHSIKELINIFMDENKLTPKLLENTIVTNWHTIAGELIARHTEKLYVKEGVLYIYINSAPLRNELSYQKQKIADVVNQYLKQNFIEQVVLR
jgi:predicted nucleic acid-binding Zn ribbon protein